MAKKWIQSAGIKKGGLHATLHKPQDEPITGKDLDRADAMGGEATKEANLARTFKKIRPHKPNFGS